MITPGFTGARLDRADPIRQDAGAFAAALADPAARLLRMDGIDPVVGADGLLDWGGLDEARGGAFLALLGLIDGQPRFVALTGTPGGARRSPLVMDLLDAWPAAEAATYAAARCRSGPAGRVAARAATPSISRASIRS